MNKSLHTKNKKMDLPSRARSRRSNRGFLKSLRAFYGLELNRQDELVRDLKL
jgi:hypothetical protein